MKISYNWLKRYAPIDLQPQEVARLLTFCGLEVEDYEQCESVKGGLKGVFVGLVTECTRHPNADSLSVCKVQAGGSEPLQIVCGAPNARVGLKAPLATVGTKMPGGMEIKQAKLRGVESH
ncbi:MAG: phenylalanine--tRNA ligase subunit beta, partial [Bacteroidales bacterium]|nr:phenylalanine--tRNA ligase subunit beta [Bacteroidales bacterium]